MKPWIILNAAMSLDARIGKQEGEIKLSNKLDQDRIQKLRDDANAILVDAETIKEKETELLKQSARIIIVDSKGILPEKAEILSKNPILVFSSSASRSKIKKLKKEDADLIVLGKYAVNLHELMDKLYRRGIRKILLEDKGHLANRMLNEGLVDELYILIAPMLIGKGINLFQELKEEKKISLEGIVQYGDSVLLHYLLK